jgi:hypothetical protein
MNDRSTLMRVRDLARSKMLELQPLAGEEMTLPQDDTHHAAFIDGERAFALRVLALIDGQENAESAEEKTMAGR